MTDQSFTNVELPSAPKWRRLPEERPQQILTAALEVFGESGLEAARLDDIARRAGVSKGTIYLYFENKEELFREVLRSTVVDRLTRAKSQLDSLDASISSAEHLRTFLQEWWTYLRSPTWSTVHRLVMAELPRFPELARFYADEVVTPSRELIIPLLRMGMDRGEFREVDPPTIARMCAALMTSHALWLCRGAGLGIVPNDDEVVLGQITDFILSALVLPQSK